MKTKSKPRWITKHFLIGSLYGITLGTIIQTVISSLRPDLPFSPGVPAFLSQFTPMVIGIWIQLICYALLGGIFSATAILYEDIDETTSLLGRSILHAVINFIPLTIIAVFLKWIPNQVPAILGFALGYLLCYIIIWFIFYWIQCSKIKRLNIEIQNNQQNLDR